MIRMTKIAHEILSAHLKPGDTAIDATCGNGYDTIFLAKLVGPNGLVHAYDIQEKAINETQKKARLEQLTNIRFHLASHETISEEQIDAVIFNLGYLPKTDKTITTKSETTIKTLTSLLNKMNNYPNLLIVLVIYPGHEEGKKESFAIESLLKNYANNLFGIMRCQLNTADSPYVIAIKKRI